MPIRKYVVVPPMEGGLEHLREIAGNLWFSWNTEAVDLFDHLDERLWGETNHNPQQVLIRLSKGRFNEIRNDDGYQSHAEKVRQRFRAYMERDRSYDYHLERAVDFLTAYFSLEFGLTECIPIYSGGHGLLAGDHLKSASDLTLPMVGVGLMYQEGYFNQKLSPDGWQQEVYVRRELDTLPLVKQTDQSGQPLRVSMNLAGETLWARVLRADVGRVPLYLLDSDVPENPPHLKSTSARLYGGDAEMRIRQGILLGVGGVRALNAMGIQPAVYHLNGGYAAFALIEMIRHLIEEKGLSLEEAREMVVSQSVLTLHTPAPLGDDVFDRGLMEKYFAGMAQRVGMDFESFLALGRRNPQDHRERFSMPVMGLRLTSRANGISKLHASLSRVRLHDVWPNADIEDVPIVPITNGVHIASYISRDMAILYDRYLGPGWNEDPDNEKTWRRAEKIPDAELWRTHERCRTRLVNHARKRLVRQLESQGAPLRALEEAEKVLDPEALTVGFARRIDTFRRATLLFKDLDRLEKLLNNPGRPVQLIFAGKAHPADNAGKELIRTIVQTARQERFRNRIVFIEDYDINVGRYMVQGTDVWLNTPRRPHQACGTSGMKAAANGGLNLSILDGWWDEAYLGDNGWAIGWREEYADPGQQDDIESRALYDLLEESVNPLFYERGADDLPREWIQMMKRSIGSICPIFNSHRMVTQYVENFYMPTAANSSKLRDNNYKALKEMVAWKRRILDDWDKISILTVEIRNEESALRGKNVQVVVTVDTAGHHPEELSVVLVHGPIDLWDNFKVRHITRLEPDSTNADSGGPVRFSGLVPLSHTGLYGYTVRATPQHPNLSFSKRFEVVCRG